MKTSFRLNTCFSFSLLLCAILLGSVKKNQAQSFYDINTIQCIELFFSQTNWDYMMDTAVAGSDSYIMADSVRINGTTIDSVGVRYKGNSSYNASQIKNPLHIELDHFVGSHIYDGITDIKLNNGFKDPSFIRETVAYSIARTYMDASRANYARLYINGTFIGLYTNVESVTKKFVASHFYSSGNAFFKCNPVYSSGSKSNLGFLGTDSASYYNSYEMKSDEGWAEILELIDVLNNNTSLLNSVVDIDRVLWMHAFNNLLVNLDSYLGAISQNYYLYKADNGSFNAIVWDLNESFGCFNSTGIGAPLSLTQMQQMTPWLHLTYTDRPLIKNLLSIPEYGRMYIAHYRTIVSEFFTTDEYLNLAVTYQGIIDSVVNVDPNKLYTYANFQNNLTQNISAGPMIIPGITLLMNGRKTYLSTQADMLYNQPVITSVLPSDTMPELNDIVTITANVQDGNTVKLGYRYNKSDRFVRITMYDDGLHNDGSSGDQVYGVEIPVISSSIEYYIYAENTNAGKFSPERAEYEFYTLHAFIGTITAGDVVINELMAINDGTITDPNGQYEDWIELYNNTESYISLKDVFLSDSYATPYKWKFPDNTTISPNGYLIIWADEDTTQTGLHASFKLSGSGENVVLSYDSGYFIDDVTFPAQTDGISYGRYPNGTGSYTLMGPTPLACNSLVDIQDYTSDFGITVYPNPATNQITINSTQLLINTIRITDIQGKDVFIFNSIDSNEKVISTEMLTEGIYIIFINNQYPLKLIKQ